MDDLVRQILAIAQEEYGQDGNHEDSREGSGCKTADLLERVLDRGAVLLQERPETIRLGVGPAEIVPKIARDLPIRNAVANHRNRIHKLRGVPLNLRCEEVSHKENHTQKS